MPSIRTALCALALTSGAGVLLASSSLALPPEITARLAGDWIADRALFYERHPELKTTPGSGWKPYNRVRWEYEINLVDGRPPLPGARWRAWVEKEERPFDDPIAPRAAWFHLGPANFAGRILALAFHPSDPNILYAGAAGGGLWRSTYQGASWIPLTDGIPSLAVSGVALNPLNPNVIVITTGELPPTLVDAISGVGILRSVDAGETWSTTSLTHTQSEEHGFHIVEAGPNGTFLAGAVDGLWRSSDDGATWSQVRAGQNHYDVKWKPGDPNTVYTVQGNGSGPGVPDNGVYVSTDDGLTFTFAGTGQPPSTQIGKSKLAVTPDDPEYVYAVFEDRPGTATTGIFLSTNGGATWEARNTILNVGGLQGWFNLSLVADPNDARSVVAGGIQLHRSWDRGRVFQEIGTGVVHVDHHDARYQPGSPNVLWVATDGGVYRSTNDGFTWTARNNALGTFQFYDICVSQSAPTVMAGGTQDNGTDVRADGWNVWNDGLGGDGMTCLIDPFDEDVIYGQMQFGALHKSTDRGATWFDIQNGITRNGGFWATPLDLDREDPWHLYTMRGGSIENGRGIYRSTDGGIRWTQVSQDAPKSISISRADGDVVWGLVGAAPGTAIYTTDDGQTWMSASPFPFPTGVSFRILAHPTDAATAFVTFTGYGDDIAHVARTTNFGATWSDVTGDLPSMPVRAIAIDAMEDELWFIGTDLGVWATPNEGVNWEPYAIGLPNVVVWDLEIQEISRRLLAGTHGRGAWEVEISPLSSTSSPPAAARSLELKLDAPMPNPARDHVVLRWASKRAGPATLDVFDVRGRLVSRLAERATGDGTIRHETWLLDDVPAGIYFAVLEASGERLSRKVVVLD